MTDHDPALVARAIPTPHLWSTPLPFPVSVSTSTQRAICPDLLSIRDIGEADGWRGRVVRTFFKILRVVTGV